MSAVYLIVLKEPIVAQDMALTLADHDPQADIMTCDTTGMALERIAPLAAVEAAFVAADPDDAEAAALFEALTDRAARIVLMGDRAEEKAATLPWTVLQRPFTSADVISLLASRV